jgi:phage terminase Nu1 subunit (DNA packaging protein)
MRRLWSDHVGYTREYILAAGLDAPNADAAAERLMKNQEDIGNAVAQYYGKDAGNKLTDLLKQHIKIAVELVDAAKKGDKNKFAEEDRKWTENAQELAGLLSGANPNWPRQDVFDLLKQHLDLTKQEATFALQKKWKEAVAKYDEIVTEALTIADTLYKGIVKQFPAKFGKQ